MPFTTISVTGASMQGVLNPGVISPISNPATINIPFTVTSPTFINQFNGTYTPANDTPTAYTFVAGQTKPTWFYIITDGQLNVSLYLNVTTMWNTFPVKKVALITLPTVTESFATVQFNGSTAAPVKTMPQGTAVNYQFWFGDGSIT